MKGATISIFRRCSATSIKCETIPFIHNGGILQTPILQWYLIRRKRKSTCWSFGEPNSARAWATSRQNTMQPLPGGLTLFIPLLIYSLLYAFPSGLGSARLSKYSGLRSGSSSQMHLEVLLPVLIRSSSSWMNLEVSWWLALYTSREILVFSPACLKCILR